MGSRLAIKHYVSKTDLPDDSSFISLRSSFIEEAQEPFRFSHSTIRVVAPLASLLLLIRQSKMLRSLYRSRAQKESLPCQNMFRQPHTTKEIHHEQRERVPRKLLLRRGAIHGQR
jgi:hypothetical protein